MNGLTSKLPIRGSRLITAAAILAMSLLLPDAAKPQNFGGVPPLSLSATAGVLSGSATEFVYDSAGYKMSQLDWVSRPLVFWGLDVNLAMPAGWHARLGLKSGLGGMTGYMTDSDWQNWDGIETNFSEASSYTDEALRLGLEGGYDLRVTDAFSMGPFLGFEYLSFQWSARDGYIQYPPESYKTDYAGNPVSAPYTPISPNTPISKVYGIGIVYQQSFVFPTLGIRATWKPFQGLGLLASFAASPLARLSETDNHVARSIIFTSTMTGGLVLAPHLRLDFEASRSLGLGLEVYYIRISNLTGDMLQTDSSGTATTDPWGAGASFEAIEGCITIRLSL